MAINSFEHTGSVFETLESVKAANRFVSTLDGITAVHYAYGYWVDANDLNDLIWFTRGKKRIHRIRGSSKHGITGWAMVDGEYTKITVPDEASNDKWSWSIVTTFEWDEDVEEFPPEWVERQ